MRLLVIVPTYCEKDTIVPVLRGIRTALPGADVLVVDDRSPDGTAELAEGRRGDRSRTGTPPRHPTRLRLRLPVRICLGTRPGYERFFAMDADLSHDPAVLPAFLAALDSHDVVIGSRYITGGSVSDWSWHRRALSSAGNWYSAWMLGFPVHDLTSGYRGYRAEILRALDSRSSERRATGSRSR